jgi:hypothetical protein
MPSEQNSKTFALRLQTLKNTSSQLVGIHPSLKLVSLPSEQNTRHLHSDCKHLHTSYYDVKYQHLHSLDLHFTVKHGNS